MLRRLTLATLAVLTLCLPGMAQEPPEGAYADFVPNANGEPFGTWGETAPDTGLVTRIFALSFAEACSWAIGNGEPDQRRPEIYDLSFRYSYDDAATPAHPLKLYRFFCNAGAYNEQHVLMLWDGDNGLRPVSFSQPTYTVELEDPSNPDSAVTGMQLTGFSSVPTLVNSAVDPATGEITTRSCFRGICDASSVGTWVLNEADYRLKSFLVDPSYDGEVTMIEMVDFTLPAPIDMSAVVSDVETATN
ncbi:MAG: hypothetical protein ACOVO5_06750 [Devosia sp.]